MNCAFVLADPWVIQKQSGTQHKICMVENLDCQLDRVWNESKPLGKSVKGICLN